MQGTYLRIHLEDLLRYFPDSSSIRQARNMLIALGKLHGSACLHHDLLVLFFVAVDDAWRAGTERLPVPWGVLL